MVNCFSKLFCHNTVFCCSAKFFSVLPISEGWIAWVVREVRVLGKEQRASQWVHPQRGVSSVLCFAEVNLSVGAISTDTLEVCVRVVGICADRG